MDQPFINQDSNENNINPTDPVIQGNIYPSENQINMVTQGNNSCQEGQPPEKPYYISSQNTNIPINSQQNQNAPPVQPYPPQNLPIAVTQQYYYSQPQGIPQNNYPPLCEGIYVQTQPVYNNQYQNIY